MPKSPKYRALWLFASFLAGVLVAPLLLMLLKTEVVIPFRHEEPPVPKVYLHDERTVIIPPSEEQKEAVVLPVAKVLFEYIEVKDGCDIHFEGGCVNVRSGPGDDFSVVRKLRNGVVLKVGGKVERKGHTWYKVILSEAIRYPERVVGDWYVAADYVSALLDEGDRDIEHDLNASSTKRIVVERGKQRLRAYDGDELFMETKISTGLELTPTPRGIFTVFKKMPSRYMQGPIIGIADEYYDLPGVPWNLYFTNEGAAIHGAYWHNNFGKPNSHGCVNLPPERAKELYLWADVGTKVIVRD